MKARISIPKENSCSIILSSLLKGAEVFSKLAILRLMTSHDKRSAHRERLFNESEKYCLCLGVSG